MSGKNILEKAIERNVSWIEAVEKAIAENTNEINAKKIMKAAGKECAQQILKECKQILGKKPENVDELIEATNIRRLEQLNLDSLWERDGNKAHLKINECGCTLVKAGLAKPNPVHCLCTAGMFESVFSEVWQGSVDVEIIKTIGFGDDVCEFYVHFQQ
jgi:predicted hydrocarbon binding protein